jgi:hypothetical protein
MIALAGMAAWALRAGLRPPDYDDMLLDISFMSHAPLGDQPVVETSRTAATQGRSTSQ